ncbi:MAG: lipopolysaccharide biosynthesis protein [Desulfobacterales bacterium]|nr:MAG: lipopolysaccharide biosynthesis protein [Desulfobacterales bacterium]
MKYRVIFRGQIAQGTEINRVVQQLASALKSDQKRIRHLFSGKTFVILKDADLKSCQKLKAVFDKAGALCRIEQEKPSGNRQTKNLALSDRSDFNPPPLAISRDDIDPTDENNPEEDDRLLVPLNEMPDPDPRNSGSQSYLSETKFLVNNFLAKISGELIDPEYFSHYGNEFVKKIKTYCLTIGEGAVELIINLAVMVMVERTYDQQGLGVYAYLLSLFFIVGYLSEFGVPRFAEHEIAKHHDNQSTQLEILSETYRSLLGLSLIFAVLFFLTAGWNTDHTRIGERAAAYLIIGTTLPLRNLNRLKLAALHGFGHHQAVAKLKMVKRLIFLGAIFILLLIGIPPSFLLIAFLLSEITLMLLSARKYKLPKIKSSWKRILPRRDILSQGYRFLFTDESLDIVLYLDFFILGLFVPSWKLGVYAEASILARFLLIVPVSVKPIFRRQYCMLAARQDLRQASVLFHRTTRLMFFIQSLLTLYILLHFPDILNFFFDTRGEELLSYRIFAVFAPGLIFFAAFTSQEPVYEAGEHLSALKKLVVIVVVVNTVLNIYLVPFAGVFGAAAATMISMLVYFFVFDRFLTESQRIKKAPYLIAGAGVYLLYALMQVFKFNLMIDFFLIPLGLFVMLVVTGFFHLEHRET